ncbi:hypothetical protein PGUG_05788 [Meyerozyma guilliermondii ATCC 6260]|uniref:GDP-Man:Man(3)GlcNAc(2)-PP-Dol alpha-1,2-mannosyltransferase n=1 Tax=Meyerozyma guilliermondii (strain ATCC 6260 / CBS 566 / DSM 6381 / JCM 1539 / NBRC 10279 / NRRL Y-324) TaxID=294746 RepID=A5DR87_PICGU|nr:uncharacterized protein PGUG_05788 [Meyerozyma guilliermondii ATCC 6260]EDK41690.2 hypothetical protein PGUG_05788 [Meyerozyma guilliermondii ATCC 6260]
MSLLLTLLGFVAVVAYILYQAIGVALPRFLLVPPHDWKEKIQKVMNHPMAIYLKVGNKRSCYRRRLILASAQPSFYTNYVNNKLKILPEDKQNEGNSFLDSMTRRETNDVNRRIIYGFFHPYANNGGGGERVLWNAVAATLLADRRNIVAIYTTNLDAEPLAILEKAQSKFHTGGIDSSRVVFIYLRRFGSWIDDKSWPRLTLVGQMLGSFLLSLEAMFELSPDIWVDTMGLPGSYSAVSSALKIPIVAYVHYPVLQSEMFGKLRYKSFADLKTFTPSLQNSLAVAKLFYWTSLYYLYKYLGSLVDITLTNGTWTLNHLQSVWSWNLGAMEILYPPCGTESTAQGQNTKRNIILYVAQFRPEKRHSVVLEEYAQYLQSFKKSHQPLKSLPTLVFLGSCRTKDDTATLEALKTKVKDLDLEAYVEFVQDSSYEELGQWLSSAKYGIDAMWNEHFGICVVEYMASGAIPLVHASAGPLLDLATNKNGSVASGWSSDSGFFFKCKEDPDFDGEIDGEFLKFGEIKYPTFSQLLTHLQDNEQLDEMRKVGRNLVLDKFSDKVFKQKWNNYAGQAEVLEKQYREDRREGVHRVY